jgi:5-methylcytosine-specific restriction protein A
MPSRARLICRHVNCGALVNESGYCDRHKKLAQDKDRAERGTASERGYTSAWTKARLTFLSRHPLCAHHFARGEIVQAAVVDHKVPHRMGQARLSGDKSEIDKASRIFWDTENWQSLCKQCHDIKTAKEDGGFGRLAKSGDADAPGG